MNKRSGTDVSSPYIAGLKSSILDSTTDFEDTLASSIRSNPDKLDFNEQVKIYSFSEQLNRFKQDTKDRSKLAYWTFRIISLWLVFVFVLLLINDLPNSVFITLLTTTTVNIIGLPIIVLRGYFTSDK